MALDTLILGPFVFTDFAVPNALPAGGRQQMRLQKLPGGDRVANTMGPDDRDRVFQGIHWGETALDDALTLDGLRAAGAALPYSNGVEARIVIVTEFTFEVERYSCIHYCITLTPIDNPNGTSGASAGGSSTDSLVSSDLGAAQATASANTTTSLPSLTPAGTAGIGRN